MNYQKDTYPYEDYYERNPDKKEPDDVLRALSAASSKRNAASDSLLHPLIHSTFRFLSDLHSLCDKPPEATEKRIDAGALSTQLKELALDYGACLVGIAKLRPEDYYTHRGRHVKNYSEEVNHSHRYGIVFATEMEKEKIDTAPRIPSAVEVTKGYVRVAILGMILSYYLRSLGYEARNHMDGNYLLPLQCVASSAGLGEVGRMGILITKDYGPRIRLGLVSTSFPLVCDEKKDIGVKEYCKSCLICAKACLGKAISEGPPKEIGGELLWKTDVEKCYHIWTKVGTDCGVCVARCPFSDPTFQRQTGARKD